MTLNPAAATTRPERRLSQLLEDIARRVAATERASTANPPAVAALPAALLERLDALEARVAALEGGPSP